jgi:hypothetical protein
VRGGYLIRGRGYGIEEIECGGRDGKGEEAGGAGEILWAYDFGCRAVSVSNLSGGLDKAE